MRSITKHHGRRVVVSTAAIVALVLGTVGTAEAAGAPHDGNANTDANNDSGPAADAVYQPCSPNFGLGKVVEIVVEVDGSVPAPPLTFPADVDVVTTFHPDGPSNPSVTCIPQPVTNSLWATSSFWGNILHINPPVGNYVFLPFGNPLDTCTETQTMHLVGQPSGYTVKVGQAIVPPALGFLCGPALVNPVVQAAAEAIMSPAAFTALTAYNANPSSCVTTPSPSLQAAANALIGALHGQFLDLYNTAASSETACDAVGEAYNVFGEQILYELEVGRQAVFELTTPPAPTTTTTTTVPTPAPMPAPAAVVAKPAFTG